MKDNQNISKEKLLAEIERSKMELKKRKKYGLVWEEKPEEVVEMCKKKLPVLKEVKNKEIITDKDKPVNLLIEGDNYHALSVLNYTNAKKVDVIYIDPPYNTGNNDFIFNDRYVDRKDAYRHSKWLAFMEKRLKLAKNLLKDTGVIFISIDDNEQAQLKLLCDDIFEPNNFVGQIVVYKGTSTGQDAQKFSNSFDYLIVYKRGNFELKDIPLSEKDQARFNKKDKRGYYAILQLRKTGKGDRYEDRPNLYYPVVAPDGTKIYPVGPTGYKSRWRMEKGSFLQYQEDNMVEWVKQAKGWVPYVKYYSENRGKRPSNLWTDIEGNKKASIELRDLFHDKIFENPKPTELIKRILEVAGQKDSTIIDFFAGTGTTAHATLELNSKDGGNRKFILCTNNENNNGNGYKIAEDICYPRVKKVIEGYRNLRSEKVDGLGGNLKYFKTDFVDYDEPTDRNKIKLTEQATEMLCVKEETFEKVLDQKNFKIFKNINHYTGIIFDQAAIPAFKKAIKDIKGKFSVYVFSLGDETFDDEFKDVKQKVQLSPIPEAILRVYRRIFK